MHRRTDRAAREPVASADRHEKASAETPSRADATPVPLGFRPSYIIYAALVLVSGAVVALLISDGGSEQTPSRAAPQVTTAGPPPGTPSTTPAPAPPAPTAGGAAPVGAVSGVPEVVDTSTLRIEGKVVRLFGVEWARGAQAEDLTRYLAGREVACTPSTRPDRHRCQVNGRDLSQVVLYNGGGRATADATPELKAAEEQARTAGLGVWQKP
jgi:endonuclease YncB( thermonuclease family)